MISRYNRPKIEKIWTLENKFKIWTDIEILIAERLSDIGVIPKIASKEIRKKAKFSVSEILKLEKQTKHDVNAYIDNVCKHIGKHSKYFHHGVTSSDIIDTGFSIQLKQTGEIIHKELSILLRNLKSKSIKYKNTVMIGRSHGIHAEPITFGLKLGSFYNEFKRNLKRLELAIEEISICSISGPVGTYGSIDPEVEKYVAKKLKLKCEDVSTQIIPRDRHAFFFSIMGIIGSSIERFAVEIRHLQRTELLEVEEKFNSKQTGSSAMPHKRNPILSEDLTGLARDKKSAVIPSMEDIVLCHERDISHSSVERIFAPDITIALDFSLNRLNEIVKTIKVHPQNMKKNINLLGGLHNSQKLLLKLTQKGLSRQSAYSIVQKNAMNAWGNKKSFFDVLKKDKKLLQHISIRELRKILETNHNNKIDWIFKNKIK